MSTQVIEQQCTVQGDDLFEGDTPCSCCAKIHCQNGPGEFPENLPLKCYGTISLWPPPNFGAVEKDVYRSSFPSVWNMAFLQSLGLRCIVNVCEEEYSREGMDMAVSQGIKLFHCPLEGRKESTLINLLYFSFIPHFDEEEEDPMRRVLKLLLDPANRPLLLHCRSGKHRTGCVVGCFRKIQGWDLDKILEEYLQFAGDKPRVEDRQFIELFDPSGWVGVTRNKDFHME